MSCGALCSVGALWQSPTITIGQMSIDENSLLEHGGHANFPVGVLAKGRSRTRLLQGMEFVSLHEAFDAIAKQ